MEGVEEGKGRAGLRRARKGLAGSATPESAKHQMISKKEIVERSTARRKEARGEERGERTLSTRRPRREQRTEREPLAAATRARDAKRPNMDAGGVRASERGRAGRASPSRKPARPGLPARPSPSPSLALKD